MSLAAWAGIHPEPTTGAVLLPTWRSAGRFWLVVLPLYSVLGVCFGPKGVVVGEMIGLLTYVGVLGRLGDADRVPYARLGAAACAVVVIAAWAAIGAMTTVEPGSWTLVGCGGVITTVGAFLFVLVTRQAAGTRAQSALR
jgi:hypothetical protein